MAREASGAPCFTFKGRDFRRVAAADMLSTGEGCQLVCCKKSFTMADKGAFNNSKVLEAHPAAWYYLIQVKPVCVKIKRNDLAMADNEMLKKFKSSWGAAHVLPLLSEKSKTCVRGKMEEFKEYYHFCFVVVPRTSCLILQSWQQILWILFFSVGRGNSHKIYAPRWKMIISPARLLTI